jgi:hypothetical protein
VVADTTIVIFDRMIAKVETAQPSALSKLKIGVPLLACPAVL